MRRVNCGRCGDDENDSGPDHNGDSDDAGAGKASLREADLRETDCYKAQFGNADLRDATLQDATLRNACLSDANLEGANLEDASIEGAVLKDAHLERAVLTRTNCFDADLSGTAFYGAVFADTKVNSGTTFAVPDPADFESRTAADADHDRRDELIWMYRTVEHLSRENALPEQARAAYIDRKDLRRRQYVDELRPGLLEGWTVLERARETVGKRLRTVGERVSTEALGKRTRAVSEWIRTFAKLCGALIAGGVMRYGERPRRVIGVSLLVLVAGALLYSDPLFEGLYVSLVSFVAPVGEPLEITAGDWLRAVEALVGVLLTAVLVFVFGRRSTG